MSVAKSRFCEIAPVVIARRFLVLLGLMIWHGGFFFHAAVVIHVGRDTIGHLRQGYITGAAATWLNLACGVSLALLAWDIACTKNLRRIRLVVWFANLLTLGLLTYLHPRLDELLNQTSFQIVEPARFYKLHAWYLHTSTAQWVCGLVMLSMSLLAWRAQDQRATPPNESPVA
jgi:hypothetical protein